MVFSEVYGSYFNAVAAILRDASREKLTGSRLNETVQRHAFGESLLTIPASLTQQSWPLLRRDGTTPLRHAPTMPLTALQKRWLKALLEDPRIQLFQPDGAGLENVEPLYRPGTFVFFDQYNDGDPFGDAAYIQNFRTVLTALKEKRKVRVWFQSGKGEQRTWALVPYALEYSAKDDKFRMVSGAGNQSFMVNVARISRCELLTPCSPEAYHPVSYSEKSLEFELTDERNALERVMLHFSHLEKKTVKLDDTHYRVSLYYRQEDETELLIRILSFGPVIRVTAPAEFIEKLRQRLDLQDRFSN